MQKLIAGIVDFRERMLPQYAQRFKELALSQAPDALFVTCSDSRVVPDLLASDLPGRFLHDAERWQSHTTCDRRWDFDW